jgi:hypothetical protein
MKQAIQIRHDAGDVTVKSPKCRTRGRRVAAVVSGTLWLNRICHASGDVEIFAADLYGAIFKPLDVSPTVSLVYEGQYRTAIESDGFIERLFIGINAFCNDVAARQFENFIHERLG